MQSLEFVTRCDLCGNIITTNKERRTPMDTLKIKFKTKIGSQDISNTKDFGHVCVKCLNVTITPMVEEARKQPNVTVEIIKK